jgi:ATP-dependent helicase HepA
LEDVSALHSAASLEQKLKKGLPHKLIENPNIARRTLPDMLQHAATLAETQAVAIRTAARNEMDHLLNHEVQRLNQLRQVNDHVRPEEIEFAKAQQTELAHAISHSRLRLDALRLIWKGPAEVLD